MNLRNKKILVTGSNGQLGYAIVHIFKQNSLDVIATDRSILDITNAKQVQKVIFDVKPDVIIHCAAYTAVDEAEIDRDECYNTNVDGTRNLATVAKELDIEFIYFSTDYVFDGTKSEPYETKDIPNPINYYGLTKYLGEEILRTLLTNYYIFRISWVFGPNGKNFVNTILRLSKEKDSINVVNDQIGSPTYTIDIAKFLIESNDINYGIHHLTNDGFISWYDFATEILRLSNLTCKIIAIQSSEYKTLARRGFNSRLNKNDNTLLPYWKKSLASFFEEIK